MSGLVELQYSTISMPHAHLATTYDLPSDVPPKLRRVELVESLDLRSTHSD